MAHHYRVEGVDPGGRKRAASFWFAVKEGDAIDQAKAFLERLASGKMVRHAFDKVELVAKKLRGRSIEFVFTHTVDWREAMRENAALGLGKTRPEEET